MPTTKAKAAASKPTLPTITPEQRYQMIAEAAYYRAERQGFCGNPAQDWLDAEAEIDRLLQQSGHLEISAKQLFQNKLEAQLQELDGMLEHLKLQASLGKAELRSEMEKQLDALMQKRNTAQAKLQELSRRSEHAWEDLKSGTEKAWDEMRKTLDQVAKRFR